MAPARPDVLHGVHACGTPTREQEAVQGRLHFPRPAPRPALSLVRGPAHCAHGRILRRGRGTPLATCAPPAPTPRTRAAAPPSPRARSPPLPHPAPCQGPRAQQPLSRRAFSCAARASRMCAVLADRASRWAAGEQGSKASRGRVSGLQLGASGVLPCARRRAQPALRRATRAG